MADLLPRVFSPPFQQTVSQCSKPWIYRLAGIGDREDHRLILNMYDFSIRSCFSRGLAESSRSSVHEKITSKTLPKRTQEISNRQQLQINRL